MKLSLSQFCFKLAFFATVLTFFVIVLGAYTRLTDAGLGCPDWPGCYGRILVSKNNPETATTLNASKAWTEMTHRYFAGLLGLIIIMLAILSFCQRHQSNQPVILPWTLVVLVLFQAILGMWTVTLKLFPTVVMAHLLGGMTTLSLLWILCLTFTSNAHRLDLLSLFDKKSLRHLRFGALVALVILIVQIGLGGWTSANYAALVCMDFPLCHQQGLFPGNFGEAFNLCSAGVTGSPGIPLTYAARVTIQMTHRIGALMTTTVLGWLCVSLYFHSKKSFFKTLSIIIVILLLIQILLGITNVLALLPLSIALLHNAIAALLLLALITVNYYLYSEMKPQHAL